MSKSKFEKLLAQAVEVKKTLDVLSKPHKLTAKAFLREALQIANSSHAKLDALEENLRRPQFPRANQFLRKSILFIKEPLCPCPPREVRRIAWLGKMDEAQAELASVGFNIFELFALAVRQTIKQHPTAFGELDSMDGYMQELASTKEKFQKLLSEIETAYGPEDLRIGQTDKKGFGQITFIVSEGAIPLAEGFPERLVNYLVEKNV